MEKLQLELFYTPNGKKDSARSTARGMNWNTKEMSTNMWHKTCGTKQVRSLKEGDTNLKDKPRPGRPSVVKDVALLEMVEQQSSTSSCTLAELGPSENTLN